MIGLILMILAFAGMWKTFEKAGMIRMERDYSCL